MAISKREPLFKCGDRVLVLHSVSKTRGRIVELRGQLGHGGMHLYRIRVKRWPRPLEAEVSEDQLKLLPPKPKPGDAPPAEPPR